MQCARCNHRWFERAGPTSGAALHERAAPIDPDVHGAADRPPGEAPSQPPPPYRSGLPAIARPQPRRLRWPLWLAGAVLLAVALGAILVFRGDSGTKSSMPWRATGLSLTPPTDLPIATAEARPIRRPAERPVAARVDIAPAIE